MTTIAQPSDVRWRTASTGNQTCVQVAHTRAAVRDSKNEAGPILSVDASALIRAVQEGRVG